MSGTGSDGSKGIIAVSDRIGMIIAESESSAQFNSMPVSSIVTGLVDHVLPVENMPTELIKFVAHSAAISQMTSDTKHGGKR